MRRAALAFLLLPLVIWVGAISTGMAAVVGYRIEVRACRAAECRDLPVSARRWAGQFACQDRAATIERYGDALPLPGLPRGAWTIRARCAAVDGLPGA